MSAAVRESSKDWCHFTIADSIQIQIDREDLSKVQSCKWYAIQKNGALWFVTYTKSRRQISLARLIMNCPSAGYAVLKDPNRIFDYRKSNIVVCSHKERIRRSPKKKPGTSKYRGVSRSRRGQWRAAIQCNGKSYNLGDWSTEEEAAAAYNKASKFYFGEFGFQNAIADDKPEDGQL
jgi:hypothetical protein